MKNKQVWSIAGGFIGIILIVGALSGGGNNNNNNNNNDTTTTWIDTTATDAPPTTVNQDSANWANWKSQFSPLWNQWQNDWSTLQTDLTNGDIGASSNDFLNLSNLSVTLGGLTHSPSSQLNIDLAKFNYDVATLCVDGNDVLTGNGNVDVYGQDVATVKNDIQVMTDDVTVANNQYQ